MNWLAPLIVLLLALPGLAQRTASQEQADLDSALAEAGNSPGEYLRALEKHLAKYPESPRRSELERAAVRAAIEANDDARIVLYGERVLARQPDDLQVLDRVTRALLATNSKSASERALKYATRYETLVRQMQSETARSGMSVAEWRSQTDRSIGMALRYEAAANGNLGRADAALALALRAFETYPDAESAREIARSYERLGRFQDAAWALADAFTIPDPRTTDAARALDRGRMGELYRKIHGGSEQGLGDLILEAYDRNVALIHGRELLLREGDANAGFTDAMQFTLTALDGPKLTMAGLKGKVVVMDFWATWCGPCRAQHPLYEQVQRRFRNDPTVVFLSINTDEDPTLVKPFLEDVKWPDKVYFEDGLSRALAIRSIPATVIIDKNGKLFSRMNGYVPERFVETLAAKIRDALE